MTSPWKRLKTLWAISGLELPKDLPLKELEGFTKKTELATIIKYEPVSAIDKIINEEV